MPVCKSCGRPIRWGVTQAHKAIPVDAEPAERGNVVFIDDGRVHVLRKDEPTTARRYVSHFATCPNAKQHRRKR
jgi:hypothetical protein